MANTGDKKIKYTISVELAQSQAKVNKLKNSVKELNDAIYIGDGRTKKNKKLKEQLIKTEERLTKATQRHTQAVIKDAGASQNSLFAINKQIQALQAENRLLDMNSQKFKDNTAAIAQHADKMNQATGATGGATSATMELSRVVSDAPYGIRGVANNLSQFTSQMFYASQAAGGLGNALKQIGKLMLGPLGIVFAITTVISIMDYMSQSSGKAADSISDLTDETYANSLVAKGYVDTLEDVNTSEKDRAIAVQELIELIPTLKEEDLEYGKNLDNVRLQIEAYSLAQASRIQIDNLVQENSEILAQKNESSVIDSIKNDEQRIDRMKNFILEQGAEVSGYFLGFGPANLIEKGDIDTIEEEFSRLVRIVDKKSSPILKRIQELSGNIQIDPNTPKGDGGTPENKLGKSMAGGSLDMDRTNDKNREKELLSVIRNEEEKQLIRDQFAQKALKSTKDNFDRAQLLRRENFIKAQELRKVNNADDEFIQKDADRLIEEANETHNQTMLQSKETYNEAKKILEETQDTATFNRQQKRESEAVDRNLRMQAMQAEADAFVKQGRFTVKQDLYEIERAQALQEQDILRARYEALQIDSDERLILEEQHAKRDLEIKTDAAKREQEIEQAKANFRDKMLGHIGAGLGAASKLFKKNSAEAKIFALAEIAVGTAKGFINGLDIAQKTAKTTPAAAYTFPLFYASQVSAVLSAAGRAKSVLQGGGASGSEPSAPPEPSFSPEFNVVGNSGSNQLAEGIGSQLNEPTRAYVVYDDIQEAGSVVEESIENSGI